MESSRHGDHVCFFIIGKIIMKGAHSVESFFSCQKELVFQHITSHKITFSLFDYLFFFFYNMR
ncbi:hypothetical protein BSUBE1_2358 [Bacillus subtilis E1]|nr:hypothetical protein ABP1_3588 [Bacillus subtilis]CCU58989.1 hypothetical protein BSUBE1_2358 [Bacillus subtilis E1]